MTLDPSRAVCSSGTVRGLPLLGGINGAARNTVSVPHTTLSQSMERRTTSTRRFSRSSVGRSIRRDWPRFPLAQPGDPGGVQAAGLHEESSHADSSAESETVVVINGSDGIGVAGDLDAVETGLAQRGGGQLQHSPGLWRQIRSSKVEMDLDAIQGRKLRARNDGRKAGRVSSGRINFRLSLSDESDPRCRRVVDLGLRLSKARRTAGSPGARPARGCRLERRHGSRPVDWSSRLHRGQRSPGRHPHRRVGTRAATSPDRYGTRVAPRGDSGRKSDRTGLSSPLRHRESRPPPLRHRGRPDLGLRHHPGRARRFRSPHAWPSGRSDGGELRPGSPPIEYFRLRRWRRRCSRGSPRWPKQRRPSSESGALLPEPEGRRRRR